MVDIQRILLGSVTIACMLQGLAGTTMVPGTTLGEYDVYAHLEELVNTLQSRETALTEKLKRRLQLECVSEIGDRIKTALEENKAEQDMFNKNITDLNPKYADCSAMQIDALQSALSISKARLWEEFSEVQNSAMTLIIQQTLSFYTSDKYLIAEPCRQRHYSYNDQSWDEIKECIDDSFKTAFKKLVASETTTNAMFDTALERAMESAELVFEAGRDSVTAASDALDADLARCKDEVDRE